MESVSSPAVKEGSLSEAHRGRPGDLTRWAGGR